MPCAAETSPHSGERHRHRIEGGRRRHQGIVAGGCAGVVGCRGAVLALDGVAAETWRPLGGEAHTALQGGRGGLWASGHLGGGYCRARRVCCCCGVERGSACAGLSRQQGQRGRSRHDGPVNRVLLFMHGFDPLALHEHEHSCASRPQLHARWCRTAAVVGEVCLLRPVGCKHSRVCSTTSAIAPRALEPTRDRPCCHQGGARARSRLLCVCPSCNTHLTPFNPPPFPVSCVLCCCCHYAAGL